jgi:hypothetical protein
VAGSTCWFLEAAPVSVRFRAAEADSGWVAVLACLAEAHLLAQAAGSPWQAVDSRERADGRAADSHEPEVDSLARAGEPEVELLVPAADFRAWVAALADSAVVHSHELEADSLGWADEPGVELPVPAVDFRARVAAWGSAAALADSAVVHSHAPEADSREPAAQPDSPGLAHSRGPAADYRAPLVFRVVLRSAWSAALPVASLPKAAVADWLALLLLCLPAALERASHSSQCETRSASVLSARRELLEPTEPSSLRLVCSQAFPGDAPTVSQEH